jgi:HD superfamily phosphohydrolase
MVSQMDQKYTLGLGRCGVRFIQSLIDPTRCAYERTVGTWFQYLVNNPDHGIDVDKMDYLVRDNHQFGLSMPIDILRIVRNCMIIDDTLCFCNKIQTELYHLFFIRHRLHTTIYRHPRIVRFDLEIIDMLRSLSPVLTASLHDMILNKKMDVFVRWTDAFVLINADPYLKQHFDCRTSLLGKHITYPSFQDNHFLKLTQISFYDKKDPMRKIRLPFPSPFCPFSLPVQCHPEEK